MAPRASAPEPGSLRGLRRAGGVLVIVGSVWLAVRLVRPHPPQEPSTHGQQAASGPAAPSAPRKPHALRSRGDLPPRSAAPGDTETERSSRALDLAAPPEAPPAFRTRSEEIAWYLKRLETARREHAAQERALARMPKLREAAERSARPEAALAEWSHAMDRLETNLERTAHRIAWYEAKLRAMGVAPTAP